MFDNDYPLTSGGILQASIILGYADFATAATTNTINTGLAIPTGAIIVGFAINVLTEFTGGSISAYDIQFGAVGDTDSLTADLDVFTATGPQVGSVAIGNGLIWPASTLRAAATASHNLSTATAGSVRVTILYYVP